MKERIDFEKLIFSIKKEATQQDEKFSYTKYIKNEDIVSINELITNIEKYPIGYGSGLARLLIYLIDKEIELL